MSKYRSLNETVRHGTFADVAAYLAESRKPNELFDALDGDRMSALHLFASSGAVRFAKFLLGIEADPNVRDNRGETPLHYAAERAKKEVVELLLRHGGEVDAQAHDGDTPLHRALVDRHREIATLLISTGADVDISNNRGITPRQMMNLGW
jgi:ankyrin repeat protein